MGLARIYYPRTLVRTWGTRSELGECKSGLPKHFENISTGGLLNRRSSITLRSGRDDKWEGSRRWLEDALV
jgi:hypothetical protein